MKDKTCTICNVKLFFVYVWFGGRGPFCSFCSRKIVEINPTITVPLSK